MVARGDEVSELEQRAEFAPRALDRADAESVEVDDLAARRLHHELVPDDPRRPPCPTRIRHRDVQERIELEFERKRDAMQQRRGCRTEELVVLHPRQVFAAALGEVVGGGCRTDAVEGPLQIGAPETSVSHAGLGRCARGERGSE